MLTLYYKLATALCNSCVLLIMFYINLMHLFSNIRLIGKHLLLSYVSKHIHVCSIFLNYSGFSV